MCNGSRSEPLHPHVAGTGLAEAHGDELLLVADDAEGGILPLYALFLGLVEPVLEAIVVLVAQLGIELVVVEVPLSGLVD